MLYTNLHGSDLFDAKDTVLAYKNVTTSRLDHLAFEIVDEEGQLLEFTDPEEEVKTDYRYNVNLGLHFRKKLTHG